MQPPEGMPVYDVVGDKLGTLIRFNAQVLIVEKGFFVPTDFSIPMAAVARIDADGVWLSLTKDDVPRQPWDGATPADAPLELAGAAI